MTTEVLEYGYAQTFSLSGTQNVSVSDSAGTNTRNLNTNSATNYYRIFLAATAGGAVTVGNPTDLLYTVTQNLNSARWLVELLSTGFVRIKYLGTGTGTITWTTTTVRNLLGFDTTVGPLATNATQTAAYLPTHLILAIAQWPDTDWIQTPQRITGTQLPDGTVSAWGDGRTGRKRSCEIACAPRDWTTRTSEDAAGTPRDGPSSRYLTPSTSEPGQAPPWGIFDQMGNQIAQRWGYADGTMQSLIAGSTSAFDVVSIPPDSLKQDRGRMTAAGLATRWNVGVEMVWVADGSRA